MNKFAIAALLCVFLTDAAVAADSGLYAGIKAGSVINTTGTLQEHSGAFGVFGGYAVNPYFAMEAGYTDLGSLGAGLAKFSAVELSAVGATPRNGKFFVFGKLGLANTTETFLGLSGTRRSLTVGLGGQIDVASAVGVRFGWDRYAFGDGITFRQGDNNFYYVGSVIKF